MGRFSDQIREFRIDFSNLSDEVFRVTVIKFFGQIVQASPVDTGRFRANWFATISRPSGRVEPDSEKSENGVNKRIERVVNGTRTPRVFWLTNNLSYSEVIEFGGYSKSVKLETLLRNEKNPNTPTRRTVNGFSLQAPQGVVRITAKRFSRIFNENARRLNRL